MTSTVMLAAMRTILDEASASFWTDAEAYAALANAQNEVIDVLLARYKANGGELPYELNTILVNVAVVNVAANTISVPSGFIWLVNATWDYNRSTGNKSCDIVSEDRDLSFSEDNVYTSAGGGSPKALVTDVTGTSKIKFLPTSSSAAYGMNYLERPTDIASGVQPALPESTHSAMVFWATARMLEKDQRMQEAQVMQKRFAEAL